MIIIIYAHTILMNSFLFSSWFYKHNKRKSDKFAKHQLKVQYEEEEAE